MNTINSIFSYLIQSFIWTDVSKFRYYKYDLEKKRKLNTESH